MQTLAKPPLLAYPSPKKPTVTPKQPLKAVWLKDSRTGHLYCKWI